MLSISAILGIVIRTRFFHQPLMGTLLANSSSIPLRIHPAIWGIFLLLAASLPVFGETYNWKGTGGGVWSLPTAWSPEGVPSTLDEAYIHDLSPPVSAYIILPGGISVRLLSLGKLEVRGIGDITAKTLIAIDTAFTIDSQAAVPFAKRVTVSSNGIFGGTISTGRLIVNNGVVTNFATIVGVRTAPNEYLEGEVPGWINERDLDNNPCELWLPASSDSKPFKHFTIDPAAPAPLPIQYPWLSNRVGALIIKTNPGISHIQWSFANTGTVRVEQGSLNIEKVGNLDGSFFVNNGAKLVLWTSLVSDSHIGEHVSFTGSGLIRFKDNSRKPFIVESTLSIPNPVEIDTASFDQFGINFLGPLTWTNLNGTAFEPFVFFNSSVGQGTLTHNILNFGSATDNRIRPADGVWWANLPFSYLTLTENFDIAPSGTGTITNNNLATVDLGVAKDPKWNFVNMGVIRGPLPGKTLLVKGTLKQEESGELQLRNGAFTITNQFTSSGLISGNGAITSLVAQVSGVIAPGGLSGLFGKISLVCEKFPNLNIASSTVFQMDLGAGTNDQVFAQGGNFKGSFDLIARDGFGPGEYVLATYIVANAGPFSLGAVPPGYRYQLINDTARREVRLIVGQPALPITFLNSTGDIENPFSLNISTIESVPYTVEFTEELGTEWLFFTNFLGDGEIKSVLPPSLSNAFFKVTEGNP